MINQKCRSLFSSRVLILPLVVILLILCKQDLCSSELIFSSGFEDSCYGVNQEAHTDINGVDVSTIAGDWVNDLEGHPNIGIFYFLYSSGDENDRFAKIIDDPEDGNNRILHYCLNYPSTDNNKGRVQSDIGAQNLYETTFRVNLFIHPDFNLLKDMQPGFTWMTLSEFWNNTPGHDYVFRITFGIRKDPGTVDSFQYRITAEKYENNIFTTIWEYDSSYNVPVGEWITLEQYFKEGNSTEGKFSVSETDSSGRYRVIFDINNWTKHPDEVNSDGVDYFNPMKLYCSGDLVDYIRNSGGALQLYWDDFELWKGDARTGIYAGKYNIRCSYDYPDNYDRLYLRGYDIDGCINDYATLTFDCTWPTTKWEIMDLGNGFWNMQCQYNSLNGLLFLTADNIFYSNPYMSSDGSFDECQWELFHLENGSWNIRNKIESSQGSLYLRGYAPAGGHPMLYTFQTWPTLQWEFIPLE